LYSGFSAKVKTICPHTSITSWPSDVGGNMRGTQVANTEMLIVTYVFKNISRILWK